jgi:hypothetical protein
MLGPGGRSNFGAAMIRLLFANAIFRQSSKKSSPDDMFSVSPTKERRLKISSGFNFLCRLLRAGALAKCEEK